MASNDPDMGDNFSRSPASLLGERVGITQFHDREQAAAEKAAAKPVARRHKIGGLRNKSTLLTGPLAGAVGRPVQAPAPAVTPEKPSPQRADAAKSKTTGGPSELHGLLEEQDKRVEELTKSLLGKSQSELAETLGKRGITNADEIARQGPRAAAESLDLLEDLEPYDPFTVFGIGKDNILGWLGSGKWKMPDYRRGKPPGGTRM